MIKNKNSKLFYGYIIVIAGFLITTFAHGALNTFGIFFKPLSEEFGWSRTILSSASSLSFLLGGFISIIIGRLLDKLGPKIIVTISVLFLSTGFLLMSQINTVWQLYLVYILLIGVGLPGTDIGPLSTVARWFVKRRGIMSGLVKVGTGTGMFIMPLVANWLISSYSWRTSYIIISIVLLVVVVSVTQFLKRDPIQMNQLPDGEQQNTQSTTDLFSIGFSLSEAIRTRQFWTISIMYLLLISTTQTILLHITPHVIDLGIPSATAASILSIIGGASILGRLTMGYSGDKIGHKRAINTSFLILSIAILWLQFTDELWMLYLFAVVYGFAHGGFFALISPMLAHIFGIASHGTIFGITVFFGTLGGAIGPVFAGYMFDTTGSYQIPFITCMAVSITGLILSLTLTPLLKPNRSD
ncbi:MAG: MFS transporter [Dehalococcoidales bacterium]|nr:MFS transporter [Dehalococcoidales bacterium]